MGKFRDYLAKPPKSKWLWIILLLALFVVAVVWYAGMLTNLSSAATAASSSPSDEPSEDDTSVCWSCPRPAGDDPPQISALWRQYAPNLVEVRNVRRGQIELERHRSEMVADVKKLVARRRAIFDWDVREINQAQADKLILNEVRQVLDRIARSDRATPGAKCRYSRRQMTAAEG